MIKVVAKKLDGTLVKGTTRDFVPHKNIFHIEGKDIGNMEMLINDLKAIFFVKKLEGNRDLHDKPAQKRQNIPQCMGKQIKVTFKDGEVIEGHSQSLHLDRLGFFFVPDEMESNNERIFVSRTAIKGLTIDRTKVVISENGFKLDKPCRTCNKLPDIDWKFCPYDGTKIV